MLRWPGQHSESCFRSIFGFTTTTGQLDWQQIAPKISAMQVTNQDIEGAVVEIMTTLQASVHRYSFKTLSIDQYWSHSWADRSWKKILVLLWLNNGLVPWTMILGTLAAVAMVPFFTFDLLPSFSSDLLRDTGSPRPASLWCLATGTVVFLLVLLLGRPQKQIYLDKAGETVCLNEKDEQQKQEGLLNMGACLKHSKSMLVLWDQSHSQQLSPVFELATFLKCHEGEKVHVDIRPTMLAPFFLVNLLGNTLIAVAQILVPFNHDWTIFVVAACFAPYFIASGCLLLRYFQSVQGLKDLGHTSGGPILKQFESVDSDPEVASERDRELGLNVKTVARIILECIHVWFGSIEEFERYVSSKVARAFSQRLGNFLCQYWMVVILCAPRPMYGFHPGGHHKPRIFWAHLDIIASHLASDEYWTATSVAVTAFTWWLGILPAAYVLFIALIAKSQRRRGASGWAAQQQLRRSGIGLKLCWRALPPCALILLLLVGGVYQTFCIRYITDALLGICIFAGTLVIPCYLIWRASTKNTAMFDPRNSVLEEASRVRDMRGFYRPS
eukprot:Skav204891  [mRNA]  locus=scaffold2602:423838:431561:+ [translate_table: standard]